MCSCHAGAENELAGEMVASPGSTKAPVRFSHAFKVKPVIMAVCFLLAMFSFLV